METKGEYKTEGGEPTLEQLMAWYRAAYDDTKLVLEELADLKAEIQSRVKVLGETVEYAGVKATYRNGYTKVTWDSKALEGFAAAHPEILPFRKESRTAPSVAVKVLG